MKIMSVGFLSLPAFSTLTLLVGRQEGHLACKKTEWWGAGVAICMEHSADLHTAQLMPLPLTVSCFSKIQIGFTFLVPAHPGIPGQGPLNGFVCVCVVLYLSIGIFAGLLMFVAFSRLTFALASVSNLGYTRLRLCTHRPLSRLTASNKDGSRPVGRK